MSVYFGLPQYAGFCIGAYMQSMVGLTSSLEQTGMPYEMHFGSDSAVHRVRYFIANQFLKSGYDRLMFIDSDIQFTPEDFWKIYEMDADIGVGVYALKTDDPVKSGYAAHTGGRLITHTDFPEKPFPVDYAGTGFMMIKRHVFEKIRLDLPEIDTVHGKIPRWFDFPIIDGVELPEDYAFCHRARQHNIKTIMHPTVRLKHWGMKGYG